MDFFEQQDKARRKTKLLVFYFALAVAALIVAVYFASLIIFTGAQAHYHRYGERTALRAVEPATFSRRGRSARWPSSSSAAATKPWRWPRVAAWSRK